MKLIELLARELKEWPSDKAAIAVQDGDKAQTIKFGDKDANPSIALMGKENVWQSEKWKCPASIDFDCYELADDWRTAIVTREEWEAVVSAPTTPTLETMLAEWRDLNARAQVAQAEADALFEHAGQCHGEIVVRLAELGWGAPRGPMVPGEPVVTLDEPEAWVVNGHTAPDDATHYGPRQGSWCEAWYKIQGDTLASIDISREGDTFDDLRFVDDEDREELLPSLISRPSTQP